jgi:hypothetical protein
MFDFACANGHKTERLTDYESISFRCECGETANRILSAPNFKLEGWSGSFPSEHWQASARSGRGKETR